MADSNMEGYTQLIQSIPQNLLFLALLSNSRSTRIAFFIPILASSVYVFFYTTGGEMGMELIRWSNIMAIVLQASDLLLINDLSKLRTVKQKKNTNELGLWDRIKWAFRLMTSTRHVGWTHEPRHVYPPHPTGPRWSFVRSRIIRCLGYLALSDVLNTYKLYTPAFKRGGASWADGGVYMRYLNSAVHVAHTWAMLDLVYTVICIVAVVLHLSEVSECPDLFGKWGDAYTVRRLWGRTWHQNLRRIVSTHGDFVALKLLCLQKDTFLATNVQRYVAFALSGLLHAAGEYAMFGPESYHHSTSMTFFLLQATAIMIEQLVGNFLGIKPSKWSKKAGYIWTFCWFSWTLPAWFDPQYIHGPQFRYGKLEKDYFMGSATNYLWSGEWDVRTSL